MDSGGDYEIPTEDITVAIDKVKAFAAAIAAENEQLKVNLQLVQHQLTECRRERDTERVRNWPHNVNIN